MKRLPAVLAALVLTGAVSADPLSAEQGDAILKELQEIKRLLQGAAQQERAVPARPRPSGARVSSEGGFSLGRDNAPLTMVEFTDFQCPYCKRFHDVVFPELKEKYIDTGTLRYVSRDLPLRSHPDAMPAALAGRCAGEQGKFWELRELLFANARNLKEDAILGYAREAALDMGRFQRCVAAKQFAAAIAKDIREASESGFSGTPSFVLGKTGADGFVDGIAIVGAKPFPYIEDRIQELLTQR